MFFSSTGTSVAWREGYEVQGDGKVVAQDLRVLRRHLQDAEVLRYTIQARTSDPHGGMVNARWEFDEKISHNVDEIRK